MASAPPPKNKKAKTRWGEDMLAGFDENAPWATPTGVLPAETTKTKESPSFEGTTAAEDKVTTPSEAAAEEAEAAIKRQKKIQALTGPLGEAASGTPKKKKKPAAETQAEGLKE